jgi:uncharacterized repeat protein (TIGR04138 family)
MQEHDFSEVVDLIRREDPRFGKGAYQFVRQALDFTISRLEERQPDRGTRHVRGPELLAGIREYALEQYGPMALTLLQEWNIQRCRDFGEIVFQLVDYGVLGKTEDDRIEDFCGGYEFEAAFLTPFLPAAKARRRGRQSARASE